VTSRVESQHHAGRGILTGSPGSLRLSARKFRIQAEQKMHYRSSQVTIRWLRNGMGTYRSSSILLEKGDRDHEDYFDVSFGSQPRTDREM
jgi:hypothetical protein